MANVWLCDAGGAAGLRFVSGFVVQAGRFPRFVSGFAALAGRSPSVRDRRLRFCRGVCAWRMSGFAVLAGRLAFGVSGFVVLAGRLAFGVPVLAAQAGRFDTRFMTGGCVSAAVFALGSSCLYGSGGAAGLSSCLPLRCRRGRLPSVYDRRLCFCRGVCPRIMPAFATLAGRLAFVHA